MKKQAFGMIAALFALVLALIVGAYAADTSAVEPDAPTETDAAAETETAELSAANIAYAILYEDGELVFQNGDTPETGRAVKKTYEVDLTAVYSYYSDAPWVNEHNSVRMVNFADKISPSSTAYWFDYCQHLSRVDNIQNLDTANVTDMSEMFRHCEALTVLDVSHFDTANVTDMKSMFSGCSGLTALDVSKFNTAKVTSMREIFSGCSGLTALDVSHFDTANVTDMDNMFFKCSGLTALDVSHFDTANVTNMESMFNGCSGLTALDVSHFDTANVTDMKSMFYGCSGLTALDVSHFDTANATDMIYMFSGCSGLTTLDVSHFDTANVTGTGMEYMFSGCSGLTALDMSHFDTANVKYMNNMFFKCSGLRALDLSHFDTANVTSMVSMFFGCSNLKTIYSSDKFTTVSVEENDNHYQGSWYMFSDCTSLVGGNGTTYDESHIDKEYARFDTPSAPGYFTYKPYAPDEYAIADAVTGNGLLSVIFSNPGAATLAVSYFDANGKFVSAHLQDVQANAGTVESSIPANAKAARAMLLDDGFRPLCAAYPAKIQ